MAPLCLTSLSYTILYVGTHLPVSTLCLIEARPHRADTQIDHTISHTKASHITPQAYIYARENAYGPNDWQKCLTVPNIGNLQCVRRLRIIYIYIYQPFVHVCTRSLAVEKEDRLRNP